MRQNLYTLKWFNLLEAIDESGSINGASEILGITYKTAYKRLKKLECYSPDKTLITSQRGGNKRGYTILTEDGREMMKKLKFIIDETPDYPWKG